MRKWSWVIVIGCGVGVLAGSPVDVRVGGPPGLPASAAQARASAAAPNREFLTRNCVACHNQRLQTAGLALDNVDVSQIGADAGKWEKVVRKLRAGAMPPVGRPRPGAAASHTPRVARGGARRAAAADTETRPSGRSPAEPGRVYERHPRSARYWRSTRLVAAGR